MGRATPPKPYPPIADYAAIGDCHTAALVSREGSIDWFCPIRFDAPAVFCRLLDAEKGGYLSVAPTRAQSTHRRYLGPTNVLETIHETEHGRLRVTDCMSIFRRQEQRQGYDVGAHEQILRRVEALDGPVEVALRFKPTPDYARTQPSVEVVAGKGALVDARNLCLALVVGDLELRDHDGTLEATFEVRPGAPRWIALTATDHTERARKDLEGDHYEQRLAATLDYWEDWARACTYVGPYKEYVLRSALALKLLMYEPTGAFVAAPTTSLPEEIGGARNWDYRFSWLRDASLMMYALTTVGYCEEATDFFAFLRDACAAKRVNPQIMYGIDGRHDLTEVNLDHLEGYRGSRPVRLGNAAFAQHQLDVYGEVLNAAHLRYAEYGPRCAAVSDEDGLSSETWSLLRQLVDRAAHDWQKQDHGIWEVRGKPRDFLQSKLMCWVALDRGLKLAEANDLEAPFDRWRQTRDEIREAILTRGYDAQQGAFTQAFGSSAIDASALAIPRVGFLPATDPRVISTIARVRALLQHEGLVCRYRTHETDDGVPGGEGTFTLCTFWMVDALALAGELDAAARMFERTIGYANDVGLLSEEIDPSRHELLGNFPQGFSHLALIGSAVNLAAAARQGPEKVRVTEAERAETARRAASEDQPVPGG